MGASIGTIGMPRLAYIYICLFRSFCDPAHTHACFLLLLPFLAGTGGSITVGLLC